MRALTVRIPAQRNTTPTPAPTLGERVADHMRRFDHQTGGDYEVAVDHRDDTAVVVWRCGMFGSMQGVRGTMLYRWLCSLRDAGFTAQARLDMEVFGKPDEESEIAWWLHVTAWTQPTPRPETPPCRPRYIERHVRLDPATAEPVTSPLGTGRPWGAVFRYWPDRVDFAIEYEHDACLLPPPQVPGWLADLAEEHRPRGPQ